MRAVIPWPAGSGPAMGELLDRAWRIVATGFCFFVFGSAGLLLGIFCVPVMVLFFRDPIRRTRASRFIVHHFFRFFIGLMNFVGVLDYELHGVESCTAPDC